LKKNNPNRFVNKEKGLVQLGPSLFYGRLNAKQKTSGRPFPSVDCYPHLGNQFRDRQVSLPGYSPRSFRSDTLHRFWHRHILVNFWRERSISIRKEDLEKVAAVGTMGLGFYQILWSLGLNLTSASNSALILAAQPLLGTLYMDLIKKEAVGKRSISE
jgi:hypothetical protein